MSRRRFIFVLLACLLVAPAMLPAQEKLDQLRTLSREELDVIKVLNAQERDWNKGDINAYLSGYKNSPDTLFVANSVNRGFDQIQLDYQKNYPTKESMGTLTFSELEPHVLDEHFALVVGKYHVDRSKKAGGPADGMFSIVFEKTDKGWKIVVAHTT
jgi:ketosteroid isomerase-like protein